jgi:hypothetical protein
VNGSSIVFLVLIFLAFAAVAAYFAHQAKLRRQAELSALARRLGWQFDPSNDSSHDSRFSHFTVFQQGHSRYAYNTLRGGVDIAGPPWRLQLGDYHYAVTQSNGKTTSTSHHHFSYVIVDTPFLGAPPLAIRREGLFDKLGGFFGFDDIDFESAQFSDRFCVKSSDKRFAYDVIHPRMMEFLLDGDPPTIDFARGQGCFFRRNKTWTADQFAAVLAWTKAFFELWPKHLQSALQGQTQSR